jgi:hypothetical protein
VTIAVEEMNLKKRTAWIVIVLLLVSTPLVARKANQSIQAASCSHAAKCEAEFSADSVLEWNKTYGTTNDDELWALVQTVDGGYALAGSTYSFGAGDLDVWLVKTDANGNQLWNQTYGGTSDDVAYALVQTGDGGFAVAGSTYSYGAGLSDFWLIKTDDNGNELWNKTFGGANYDIAMSVVQTVDGGYALAGCAQSFGAGNWNAWLVKTDEDGNMLWNNTYGGTNNDGARSLIQTSDGDYVMTGSTVSFSVGLSDFWLIKTDTNGNHLWNKTYGGANWDDPYALIQTDDDGYAISGCTQSFGTGNGDFWLVKTDASGNQLWNKTYGGINEDRARSLVQTDDDGYAMAGPTYSSGVGDADFWLVKTDADGNHQWNRTYGGANYDWANGLAHTTDGGYALAGVTRSFGAGNNDFWLVKTDENGVIPEFQPTTFLITFTILTMLATILARRKQHTLSRLSHRKHCDRP